VAAVRGRGTVSDMSDGPQDKPRPTPRPRAGATARPSPRPRVAGSRRDRDESDDGARSTRATPVPRPRPAARNGQPARSDGGRGATTVTARDTRGSRDGARRSRGTATGGPAAGRRGLPRLAVALLALCLLAAAAGGFLLWQRLHPPYVNAAVFSATKQNIQKLYAFDYKTADRSVAGKLTVLTGPLRDQYSKDLQQGGIIDTYKQVSATTSYNVVDVGLQQINNAQDAATLVVFGQYVVKSANSGTQQAPQGSECSVTTDGAQSCTQTVQVQTTKVGGQWKINQVTILTSS
jgi:hypothetical protein